MYGIHGWTWVLYHRDSRQAIIATGVTDDSEKARRLVETAATVADAEGGVGQVMSPVGVYEVLHKTPDGYEWRPMFADETETVPRSGAGEPLPGTGN